MCHIFMRCWPQNLLGWKLELESKVLNFDFGRKDLDFEVSKKELNFDSKELES